MRLGEIRFQAQGDAKLRNAFGDVFLRQEHPPKKIVSLGVTGCELYNLFECGSRLDEVAALQGRQTPSIRRLGWGGTLLGLSQSAISQQDYDRRQHYQLERNKNQGTEGAPLIKTGRRIWFEGH